MIVVTLASPHLPSPLPPANAVAAEQHHEDAQGYAGQYSRPLLEHPPSLTYTRHGPLVPTPLAYGIATTFLVDSYSAT